MFFKYSNILFNRDPSIEGGQFEPVSDESITYVELTNDGPVSGVNEYSERMQFWDDLFKKYDNFMSFDSEMYII